MTIEPLMSRHVHSCRPDQTLDYAASQMWEHDCGCLPVCAGDGEAQVIGMLTDRDICMAALFQGRPLRDLKVADAMSRDIRVCEIGDRAEDVELLMREQRIRRVPVDGRRAARSSASCRLPTSRAPRSAGRRRASRASSRSAASATLSPPSASPAGARPSPPA